MNCSTLNIRSCMNHCNCEVNRKSLSELNFVSRENANIFERERKSCHGTQISLRENAKYLQGDAKFLEETKVLRENVETFEKYFFLAPQFLPAPCTFRGSVIMHTFMYLFVHLGSHFAAIASLCRDNSHTPSFEVWSKKNLRLKGYLALPLSRGKCRGKG